MSMLCLLTHRDEPGRRGGVVDDGGLLALDEEGAALLEVAALGAGLHGGLLGHHDLQDGVQSQALSFDVHFTRTVV